MPKTTLTTSLNAEALRRVLAESFLWHFPQIKDLIKSVIKKEAAMRSAKEIT